MTSPDSDYSFHPENPEPNQTPQRIELNQTMSPEGSVGFNLFPAILAGRKRPETTFNQPLLGSIWETNNAKALQELQGQGLVTVVDVLRLSET